MNPVIINLILVVVNLAGMAMYFLLARKPKIDNNVRPLTMNERIAIKGVTSIPISKIEFDDREMEYDGKGHLRYKTALSTLCVTEDGQIEEGRS